MENKVNLNRGTKIVFAPCSNPHNLKNVVLEKDEIKIIRCGQHGGYYLSLWGSSGGYHYETIQAAFQAGKSHLRFLNELENK